MGPISTNNAKENTKVIFFVEKLSQQIHDLTETERNIIISQSVPDPVYINYQQYNPTNKTRTNIGNKT